MPSSHLILYRLLLLLSPIPPSIRVFSNESTLRMRWPKYWSFSFSIIPSEEIPGLISFRIDWLDLLAVHRTLKSLFQHHSSKVLVLLCSAFFIGAHEVFLILPVPCTEGEKLIQGIELTKVKGSLKWPLLPDLDFRTSHRCCAKV